MERSRFTFVMPCYFLGNLHITYPNRRVGYPKNGVGHDPLGMLRVESQDCKRLYYGFLQGSTS